MPDRPEMIGVLVDELEGEYQIAVIAGVVDAAREAGERILAELDGQQLTTNTGPIPIECSLGFGMLPSYAGQRPDASKPLGPAWFTAAAEALIASADAAFNAAKKQGETASVVASPSTGRSCRPRSPVRPWPQTRPCPGMSRLA